MLFHRSLCILSALAEMPTGATVGMLEVKLGQHLVQGRGVACRMTRSQISTCIKHLELDGYVFHEAVKYRDNMDKKLYFVTWETATELVTIGNALLMAYRQLTLPSSESNFVGGNPDQPISAGLLKVEEN